MGERYPPGAVALVVTSDLRRAWRTADLAFGRTLPTALHPARRNYAIAHLLAGVPLLDQIRTPFAWPPGWHYDLRRLR